MQIGRRRFLTLLAAGTALAAGCARAEGDVGDTSLVTPTPSIRVTPARPFGTPTVAARAAAPAGPLTALPGPGTNLALTIDDGVDTEVVGAYIQFAKDTGARFTFFVTGVYDSWRTHRDALRPLVDSGQIQLGNHTWDHPNLTALSASGVADQLDRTKTFLRNNFGVDGTPFYRPPYGYHDDTVDSVAADRGYVVPTLWTGSLSDSGIITEQYLLECARKYFQPQAIVIGHANHLPVTRVYGQLVDIIRERRLSPVTLNDVIATSGARGH